MPAVVPVTSAVFPERSMFMQYLHQIDDGDIGRGGRARNRRSPISETLGAVPAARGRPGSTAGGMIIAKPDPSILAHAKPGRTKR
jgi:hypothetical protein